MYTSAVFEAILRHLFLFVQVVFHPKEGIIGSCGSDKNIYLGEIGV